MIRVSTRGRYALRAMLDLALHGTEGPVSRQTIAERQHISADYVAQLFRQLGAAGLVTGVKGPGGGYQLARSAAEISAGDVVRAVEGPVEVVQCTLLPDGSACRRMEHCVANRFWTRLSQAIGAFLDAATLQDLSDEACTI
jgi:Rrf2 family protein